MQKLSKYLPLDYRMFADKCIFHLHLPYNTALPGTEKTLPSTPFTSDNLPCHFLPEINQGHCRRIRDVKVHACSQIQTTGDRSLALDMAEDKIITDGRTLCNRDHVLFLYAFASYVSE